jgi:beta,beta-carotene 9',10'-dioxygenase
MPRIIPVRQTPERHVAFSVARVNVIAADMRSVSYRQGFTTLASETSVPSLPVRGRIPDWLVGTLVRTGPARFEVGRTRYNHWFDGLAMLHGFAFAGGAVSYANRYLHSGAHEEAVRAGTIARAEFATDPCRTLFQRVASWFAPKLTDNGCVNVVEMGEAVVALTETRLPVRFDRHTLATLGVAEYDRGIRGPLSTAHPHFDAVARRHVSFVLDLGRRSTYRFFAVDRATARQSGIGEVRVDRPAYVHSFGMTERYLLLVECPLVVNPLRLRFGGKPFIRNYAWRPDIGTRFHILEKATGKVVRRARTDAFFAFHHVNAFEDGSDVVADLVTYPDAGVIDQLYLDRLRSSEPVTATGRLTRFRLGAAGVRPEPLSPVPLELPRFDYDRRAGRPYRYVYGASNVRTSDFLDSLVKVDLELASSSMWVEDGCYPGEPVFVGYPGATREDAGVVLSIVLDARAGTSFLLVLDASTFAEVARAEVPHHVPFGFHGTFLRSGAAGS